MKERRREREIIHNMMEAYAQNWEESEPAERTDSLIKAHRELILHALARAISFLALAVGFKFIVDSLVLIIKLFG